MCEELALLHYSEDLNPGQSNHLNTGQPNHLNTGQMDAFYFSYVLVWYSNSLFKAMF